MRHEVDILSLLTGIPPSNFAARIYHTSDIGAFAFQVRFRVLVDFLPYSGGVAKLSGTATKRKIHVTRTVLVQPEVFRMRVAESFKVSAMAQTVVERNVARLHPQAIGVQPAQTPRGFRIALLALEPRSLAEIRIISS